MVSSEYGVKVNISKSDSLVQTLEKAVLVRPSTRQVSWQSLEMTAFMHFGMNTFRDCEWGDGSADPKEFCPQEIDAEQWVRVIKNAGFRGLILTCKHHDGFCLWPSAYTDYSVKNSPYKNGNGDVVKEVSDACHKAGIKFGIYLSPWDMHDSRYGNSPEYNRFFLNQLTELLTGYGDIFEVWFDGACAEGPNGKRQEYAWKDYYSLIRSLQPEAVISIEGPDVRWVGNEAGKGRNDEWSVIPGFSLGEDGEFSKPAVTVTDSDLASDNALANLPEQCDCLYWSPAQVDTSIRPGWFYHEWEDNKVKSLYELVEIYDRSVGANAELLLNIPPDKNGRINARDEKRLAEFGKYIRDAYMQESSARFEPPTSENNYTGHLSFDEPQPCNCVILSENIAKGQRVSAFTVKAVCEGETIVLEQCKTIGYKKIVKFKTVTAKEILIQIDNFRAEPILSFGGAYLAPDVISPMRIERSADGVVSISYGRGAEAFYAIDNGEAIPYTGPFSMAQSGKVTALATYRQGMEYKTTITEERQFGALRNKWHLVEPKIDDRLFQNYIGNDQSFLTLYGFPCSITVDLGESLIAKGVEYNSVSGALNFLYNVYEIEFAGSMDGINFQTFYSGRLDNMKNNPISRYLAFAEPFECRYFRFTALSGFDENKAAIGSFELVTP